MYHTRSAKFEVEIYKLMNTLRVEGFVVKKIADRLLGTDLHDRVTTV